MEVNSGRVILHSKFLQRLGIIWIIGIVLYYKVSEHMFSLNGIAVWFYGIAKCHGTGAGCRYQSQPELSAHFRGLGVVASTLEKLSYSSSSSFQPCDWLSQLPKLKCPSSLSLTSSTRYDCEPSHDQIDAKYALCLIFISGNQC